MEWQDIVVIAALVLFFLQGGIFGFAYEVGLYAAVVLAFAFATVFQVEIVERLGFFERYDQVAAFLILFLGAGAVALLAFSLFVARSRRPPSGAQMPMRLSGAVVGLLAGLMGTAAVLYHVYHLSPPDARGLENTEVAWRLIDYNAYAFGLPLAVPVLVCLMFALSPWQFGLTTSRRVRAEAPRCGKCGAARPAGAEFCPSCGAPAATPSPAPETPPSAGEEVAAPPGQVTCRDCGTTLPPDAEFCAGCGAAVRQPKTETPPPNSQQPQA